MSRVNGVQRPWQRWDVVRLRRNTGVYIHIPLCLARCGYCDFLTFGRERPAGLKPAAYTGLICRELELWGEWYARHYAPAGRVVDTVFLGGGTPTCLSAGMLGQILATLRESLPLSTDAEVTVEANPDTLSPQLLQELARAGINRLSIGIQSTHPRLLRHMERTHRWQGIQPALRAVADGPIPRLSFDLIYGVHGQSPALLRGDVRRLLEFRPEHISAYELTIEPGTPYARRAHRHPRLLTPSVQVVAQQRSIARTLAGAGMYRYEVSSYARPEAECRHNLRYWCGGDYLGVGLGAASRIGELVFNQPREFTAYRELVSGASSARQWLPPKVIAAPCPPAAPEADSFLRLRTRRGIPLAEAVVDPQWIAKRWVEPRAGWLAVTSRGLDFADTLALAQQG